jgi:hypothetical protein
MICLKDTYELVSKIDGPIARLFPDHPSAYPDVEYLAPLFAYLYRDKWEKSDADTNKC